VLETNAHPLLPVLEEIPHHPGRTFLHRVDSDQWKELGLKKHDRLLLEFRPLKEGDLALILHHGQTVLTRYRHLPQPTFLPPSPAKPIPQDDAVLQGVVTCLVRTM
jgi:hypothetical protein